MTKILTLLFLLLFQTSLFSLDSLLINQKLAKLEHAEGVSRLTLLSDLSILLRTLDNPKSKLLAEEGLVLAKSLADSAGYYMLSSNLAIINSINSKYEEGIRLQKKVLIYHQSNGNKKEEAEALNNLGSIFSDFGKHHAADSIMVLADSIFRQINDKVGLMNLKLQQGINFLDWAKYSPAEAAFKEALELGNALNDTTLIPKLWNNLGIVARRQSDLTKALEYYFQASLLHQSDDLFKAKVYNNIGIIYKTMGDFDASLEFYQKSLAIKEKLQLKKSISYTLHNMGTLYKVQLDYGEALKCYHRSLEIKKQLEGNNNGLTKTLNNIGTIYFELGKYEEAEDYFRTHLKTSQEDNNQDEICRALNNLSALYIKMENYQEGINYGKRSLDIAEQINYPKIIRSASKNLAESYQALGDSYNHLYYQNQYWVVNDSILNKETIQEISKLEKQYEQSLLKQNSILQNEKQEQLESRQRNENLKISFVVVIFLLLLFFLGGLAYKNYQRQLSKSEKKWNEELEKSFLQIESLKEKISQQQIQFLSEAKELIKGKEQNSNLERTKTTHQDEVNKQPILSDLHSFLNENLQTEENWKDFQNYFTTVHKDFFKTLKSTYPNLTTYDLNLCAFIKLNLHNKEIAQILGISPSSVKKARQRLSKKMNTKNSESLVNYIIQL